MKETNKWICALAYLIFFIPLLVDSDKEEYKFHANQGSNLLLLSVAIGAVGTVIPVIGWFLLLPIGGLLCFVLAIMGIVNAINENMKELPLIGKFKLIK
ncbi:MAG: hypothetical protein RBS51_03340 [Anaerovoracaceae bacterium]|jgi:uncharacterized membrane protein|nr:hypothetical protein [Anaerovoracaceae bacterium]